MKDSKIEKWPPFKNTFNIAFLSHTITCSATYILLSFFSTSDDFSGDEGEVKFFI